MSVLQSRPILVASPLPHVYSEDANLRRKVAYTMPTPGLTATRTRHVTTAQSRTNKRGVSKAPGQGESPHYSTNAAYDVFVLAA
jgi:hypothetical protein